MESQPRNPEFRINPENFHPCCGYSHAVKSSRNLKTLFMMIEMEYF